MISTCICRYLPSLQHCRPWPPPVSGYTLQAPGEGSPILTLMFIYIHLKIGTLVCSAKLSLMGIGNLVSKDILDSNHQWRFCRQASQLQLKRQCLNAFSFDVQVQVQSMSILEYIAPILADLLMDQMLQIEFQVLLSTINMCFCLLLERRFGRIVMSYYIRCLHWKRK